MKSGEVAFWEKASSLCKLLWAEGGKQGGKEKNPSKGDINTRGQNSDVQKYFEAGKSGENEKKK